MLPTHNNTSLNKLISDLDYSAHDSGLDTPPSTHRPSSYRELPQQTHVRATTRDSTETSASSSRGTNLNSPGGSFRAKQVTNSHQVNVLQGSRYSIQERVLKIHNEEDHSTSINSANRVNHNESFDPNQNRYYKNGNQMSLANTPHHTPVKMQQSISHSNQMQNQNQPINGNVNSITATNNNNNNAINSNVHNGSSVFRERYQHPALAAIINEAHGMKFRGMFIKNCCMMQKL